MALKLSALRRVSDLSQKELARMLVTSQQQISRLESLGYEGHSLSMLRRVAGALGATVNVQIEPESRAKKHAMAEKGKEYKPKR